MSSSAEDRARAACTDAVRRLREAGVAPEALAELVPEGRRLIVLRRPAHMRPLGEVWRLGVLLLGTDGRLYASGRATRAAERGRVGYQSTSREERRELAAAALRGGYPEGTPVNFDAVPLPLGGALGPGASALGGSAAPGGASGGALDDTPEGAGLSALGPGAPIGFSGGEIRVRWRAGAPLDGAQTLAQYLEERVELLVDPPLGAT